MSHRGISHYPLHDFYEFSGFVRFPGGLTLARLTQGVQKSCGFGVHCTQIFSRLAALAAKWSFRSAKVYER